MKDYRLNPGLRKSCKQVLHCYSLDDKGHLSFQDIPRYVQESVDKTSKQNHRTLSGTWRWWSKVQGQISTWTRSYTPPAVSTFKSSAGTSHKVLVDKIFVQLWLFLVCSGEGKMLGCLAAAARVSSFTLEPECKCVHLSILWYNIYRERYLNQYFDYLIFRFFSGLFSTDASPCTTKHCGWLLWKLPPSFIEVWWSLTTGEV